MRRNWLVVPATLFTVLLCASVVTGQWQTVFQAGAPGRGWPIDGVGGGPDVDFVQEAGVNPPPGDPNSPAVNQQADDDYYFAGEYPAPIGVVADDEIAFERAFAGIDNDLRIHFNLSDVNPADKFRFSLEANNLDERAENPDPRYGVEVLINDTLVMPEIVISPAELSTVFTSAEFTAADLNLVGGPGADNVVWVRGINYNAEGGGNWMGLDYHHLETIPIPEPAAFSMMFSGMIWAFPIMFYERQKGRKLARR